MARRLLTLKRTRELKQDGGGLSNYLHGKTVKHLFANNLKGYLARAYANAVVNKTGKKALKGLAAAAIPLAGVSLAVSLTKRRKRQEGGVTSTTNRQAIRSAENAMRNVMFRNKLKRHSSKALLASVLVGVPTALLMRELHKKRNQNTKNDFERQTGG